jgi:hypothetical protein
MALPALLAGHVHVSERESAHHWPDGQFDDAAWEDCEMCAGVMQARLAHDLSIPYTHAEAERLRDDAGEDPIGGTSAQDLNRGLGERYDYHPLLVAGWDELWEQPTPWVAAAQGTMGAFPSGHWLRRHQPGFHGPHSWLMARLKAEARVWIDDPLAPTGGYQGEYISSADARRFVTTLEQQFTPWAVVGKLAPVIQLPDTSTTPVGRVRVTPGAWWDYSVHGSKATGYTATRIQRISQFGFSAELSTIIKPDVTWGGKPRRWARVGSGAYLGRWVDLNDGPNVRLLAP